MDWTGSVLAVIGLILLNFVWNQGPLVGWGKACIIVLLIVSIVILAIFVLYELRRAVIPLLPREIMKSRPMLMVLLALFLGWGSFGIFSFYYFAFLLNIRKYNVLWAGGTYFMFAIWGMIAALVVGFTIRRSTAPIILFLSMLAFTAGNVMFAVTPVHETYFRMNLGTMIVLSFGMDMSFPASSIMLSDFLPMQYQGMAGSLAYTMVNYSMSLCLGMATTVEKQVNDSGKNLLKGYRGAEYLSVGLAGLGIVVALIFMIENLWIERNENLERSKEENLS